MNKYLQFYKYQGTGNDFVLIDNRLEKRNFTSSEIMAFCDRRFGIGADGLMLIQNATDVDFEVVYYNSDASQSFCGNGARCAVAFAHFLKIIQKETTFKAIDGLHKAIFNSDEEIEIFMQQPFGFEQIGEDYFIQTGSPHYVSFCDKLAKIDILSFGKSIRYSDRFKTEGVNVNVVEEKLDSLSILTYERGVEDETLSCGTGATAVALIWANINNQKSGSKKVKVKGGELTLKWSTISSDFDEVILIGPAKKVYEGQIEL